jgi:DNA-directed DNA polymerase III PolC
MTLFAHIIATEFSDDEGYGKVKEFIEETAAQAKESGEIEPALILAEKFSTASYIPFFEACNKNGVKPVFGVKVTVQGEQGLDHDLILVAKNEEGRQNINKIVTEGHIVTPTKEYKKITRDILENNKEGLACISGGENGLIEHFIINDEIDKAKAVVKYLKKTFNNDFYIQIKRTNESEEGQQREEKVITYSKLISEELDVKLFASNDVRFAKKENYKHHLTRKAILDGEQVYDPSREIKESENQYLIPTTQMLQLFENEIDSIYNTGNLINRIDFSDFKNRLGVSKLPIFPIPEEFNDNPNDYLKHVTEIGFENIWGKIEDKLRARMGQYDDEGRTITEEMITEKRQHYSERNVFELDVIEKTGFPGYFLIVHELVQWCKDNDIPVGPGRGSGAGSLVLYSLGITDVDPIEYDLLFERFLNPERMSEPDIDIDFSPKNRDRVINHMAEMYGRENTAQILTEGTMAPKSAIDSIGRVRGLLPYERERIKNLISEVPGTKLKDEMEYNESLKELYAKSRQVRRIVDEALILEGSLVSYGKHAGGVVISLGDMNQYAALYREEGTQAPVVQIDKDLCERVGLIKFDILGLNNLDIIKEAVDVINEGRLEKDKIDINNIPFDDVKTIELFQNANTYGVFQFDSPSMRRLMKDLRPDNFAEVVALVALFRPGPLQAKMDKDFVERKYDNSLIKYPHPRLESILKETYGTIIYQEQVMNIARELAGFTLGQADILRKAMGKKIKEMMDQQREFFASGAADQFREQTKQTTGKKFVLKSTGQTKEIDIVLTDIEIPFVKNNIGDTDGKIKRGEQIIDLLKEYAEISPEEVEKLEANINYIEEKEFFNTYFPKLREKGIPKLMNEQGINEENAETVISRLTVASGIFIRFNKIFSLMDKFAAYGFNKSHSVAYAKVSMQTAYLKANYPAQYMASLISNQSNINKASEAINECRKMNLNIIKPDINESQVDFKAVTNTGDEKNIRYGLGQIKGLKNGVAHIIKNREKLGAIKDIYDLYNKFNGVKFKDSETLPDGTEKVTNRTIMGKTVFNKLLNAGAFDSLCPNEDSSYRTHLFTTYKNLEEYDTLVKKAINENHKEFTKKAKELDLTNEIPELKGTDLKKHLTEAIVKKPENVMEILNKVKNYVLENSTHKTFKVTEIKTFENFLKDKNLKFNNFEQNGENILYVEPEQGDYTVIPDIKTKERALIEYELTGYYQTAHPLYSEETFETLKKEDFNIHKIKNLPKMIEMDGQGRKRKYLDLKIAGAIIDVSDFKRFNEDTGEDVTNVTLLIDDGTGTATVRFKAEELFQDGKIQRGIDILNNMKNKEVIKIEGASTQGFYHSAGVTIYANKLGTTNPEIILPVDDKSLNSELSNDKSGMKNEKPATEGQINFVKSLLKQNRVSHENFMKDNNIDAMEDISVKLAQSAIQQYNVKKRGNKP